MDSSADILRLCRLCLVKDQVNVPIFDEEDVRQVFLKISTCLPVKISENDELPKKICDGCSHKLDSFYEFWTSTGSAQETLLSLIAQKAQTLLEPTIPKPINVKKETEVLEESSKDDTEEPASKRPRRSAAIKAQSSIMPESDDEDGDLDTTEIVTKEEIEELESSYTEMAGSSVDEAQPGPSGVGKNEVEPGSNLLHTESDFLLNYFKELQPKCIQTDPVDLLKECEPNTIILNGVKKTQLGGSNIKPKTFDCLQCPAQFRSLKYLYRHMVNHPGKDGCYYCMNCGYKTQSLLSHLPICLRRKNPGSQLADIQPQKLSSASIQTTFKCPHCRLIFNSKFLMADHVCEVTRGFVTEAIKLFKCRICEKMYIFKHSLLHHLKVHELPFSCPTPQE